MRISETTRPQTEMPALSHSVLGSSKPADATRQDRAPQQGGDTRRIWAAR